MWKSELLGFPPVACLARQVNDAGVVILRRALVSMSEDPEGQEVLAMLRLDGFIQEPVSLYEPIAAKMRLARSISG